MTADAMEPARDSRNRRLWAAALGLPILAGVITWVLTDATTSVASCQDGGEIGIGAAVWALALAPPLLTAAEGWRAHNHPLHVTAATLTAGMLTVALIFIATQIWWIGHNCFASIVS